MSRRAVGIGCLIIALATHSVAAQNGSQSPAGAGIGFVDLVEVMLLHPKYVAAVEAAKREAVAKREVLRNRGDARRSMVQDLDLLRPGSKEAISIRKRISIHDKTLEIDYDLIHVEFQAAIVKSLREVYALCSDAISKVARDRGFTLVLNRTRRPVGGLTQYDYLSRLSMRDTLYVAGDLDITADVMKALDIDVKPKDEKK